MAKNLDSVDGIVFEIKEGHYNLVGRVITQYARLEYALTQWIIFELDIPAAKASIIIGRVGVSSKFEKLIKLYQHGNNKKKAEDILDLKKAAKEIAKIRNIITHNPLIAHVPASNHNTILCFSSDKYVSDKEFDAAKVHALTERQIDECALNTYNLTQKVFAASPLPQH